MCAFVVNDFVENNCCLVVVMESASKAFIYPNYFQYCAIASIQIYFDVIKSCCLVQVYLGHSLVLGSCMPTLRLLELSTILSGILYPTPLILVPFSSFKRRPTVC